MSEIKPELPRYGIRWNGPTEPVSVLMDDGYWTPWHLAQAQIQQAVDAFHDASRLRSGIQQARMKAEDERDEARAEADRLRSDVASLEAGITAQDEVLTARYNKQLARSETAYRRGAEAMREAAGVSTFIVLLNQPGELREAAVSAIRSLPIPEDKQ